MQIDINLPIPVADGVVVRANLYRPEAQTDNLPVLLCWGPYGKDQRSQIPGHDISDDWISSYTAFESLDPLYWTAHGYAVAVVDPRGTWGSDGDYYCHEVQEIDDVVTTIEWIGSQDWSNGRVGMAGVSYFAETQWLAAARKPSHLAAINPWEGYTDAYRDYAYHDGIPEMMFHSSIVDGFVGLGMAEDTFVEAMGHPLIDDYWRGRIPVLEEIQVPAFVVASWSDHGLHSRGTLRGYERIQSSFKWLDVHGEKKWRHFYKPESVERARQFFDAFLKGPGASALDHWPPVRLQVRDATAKAGTVTMQTWPPSEQDYLTLFLHEGGRLDAQQPKTSTTISYSAVEGGQIQFDFPINEEITVMGSMELRLWLQIEGYDDADLFVAIKKVREDGSIAQYPFFSVRDDGDVALGWLRASHRNRTDDLWSVALTHEFENKISPQEVVPVTVDIWPTATTFRTGESLRLVVSSRDLVAPIDRFGPGHAAFTEGTVVLHMSAQHASALIIPLAPSE